MRVMLTWFTCVSDVCSVHTRTNTHTSDPNANVSPLDPLLLLLLGREARRYYRESNNTRLHTHTHCTARRACVFYVVCVRARVCVRWTYGRRRRRQRRRGIGTVARKDPLLSLYTYREIFPGITESLGLRIGGFSFSRGRARFSRRHRGRQCSNEEGQEEEMGRKSPLPAAITICTTRYPVGFRRERALWRSLTEASIVFLLNI